MYYKRTIILFFFTPLKGTDYTVRRSGAAFLTGLLQCRSGDRLPRLDTIQNTHDARRLPRYTIYYVVPSLGFLKQFKFFPHIKRRARRNETRRAYDFNIRRAYYIIILYSRRRRDV